MKKLLLVREILNGLVRLVKAIRCKVSCCCESECGRRQSEDPVQSPQSPSVHRDQIFL